MISAVAALAIGGTVAYFSDTETSTSNTITAGTIDLAVNGHNPLDGKVVEIKDIKPSENVPDTEVWLNNVGTNDGVADLHILAGVASENVDSEPECEAECGVDHWVNNACNRVNCPSDTENICTKISYDYTYDANGNGVKGDNGDLHGDLVASQNVYLDVLPAGVNRKLWLSHHLMSDAGNRYQGDTCTYNIEFSLHQLSGDPSSPVISFVDVGNPQSEDSKDMKGWGPIEPTTHGGNWGGKDDGTIRTVAAVNDNYKSALAPQDAATVVMDFGAPGGTKKLYVRHLDGAADDSFNVSVDGTVWTYSDSTSAETWMTDSYDVSAFDGVHTVKIELTGAHWSGFNTWGQLGISWIKIVK